MLRCRSWTCQRQKGAMAGVVRRAGPGEEGGGQGPREGNTREGRRTWKWKGRSCRLMWRDEKAAAGRRGQGR